MKKIPFNLKEKKAIINALDRQADQEQIQAMEEHSILPLLRKKRMYLIWDKVNLDKSLTWADTEFLRRILNKETNYLLDKIQNSEVIPFEDWRSVDTLCAILSRF